MKQWLPLITKAAACVLGLIAAMAFLSALGPKPIENRYSDRQINDFVINDELRTIAHKKNQSLPAESGYMQVVKIVHSSMELTWHLKLLKGSVESIDLEKFRQFAHTNLRDYWCTTPSYPFNNAISPTEQTLRSLGKRGVQYTYVYEGTRGENIAQITISPTNDCREI